MKPDLEPAKQVLQNFLADIEKVNILRKSMSAPQAVKSFTIKDREPEFNAGEFNPAPDSFWEEENAYTWLYADPWNYRALMHKPKQNPIPEYYLQHAKPLYLQWKQENKEVFHRKCKQIPLPEDEVSLLSYLQQLAITISDNNENRDVWIESLRSFLHFLREDTEIDQKGVLEQIFPSKES